MKKKTLTMLLSTLLIVSSAALGSIAYMTDTAEITNRFTVGNVSLKVDETKVDSSGAPVDGDGHVIDPNDPSAKPARTESGNAYHLMPGETYVKDPTVTIGKNSESSYVRLLVTVSKARELDALCKAMTAADAAKYPLGLPQDHVSGYDAAVWRYAGQTADAQANTVTYEFRYFDVNGSTDIVKPDGVSDLALDPLFDTITVPGALTGSQLATLNDFEIRVVGQAIQSAGFADANEAWAAFPQMTEAADAGDGSGQDEAPQA